MKGARIIIVLITMLLLLAGCATHEQTGAPVGGAAGGLAGSALGGGPAGTLLGAAGGALLGGYVGRHMDQQDRYRTARALE